MFAKGLDYAETGGQAVLGGYRLTQGAIELYNGDSSKASGYLGEGVLRLFGASIQAKLELPIQKVSGLKKIDVAEGLAHTGALRVHFDVKKKSSAAYADLEVDGLNANRIVAWSGELEKLNETAEFLSQYPHTIVANQLADSPFKVRPFRNNNDAEMKLFTELRKQLKGIGASDKVSGTIRLFIDNPKLYGPCMGCRAIIEELKFDFPNIDIVVSWSTL